MKKTLVFLAAVLSLALFIAGCGGGTTETTTETATEETTDETTTETTTEETAVEEETATEEATTEEAVTEEETAETIEVAGCTDTDGGKNYDVAGDIIDARGVTDSDRCSQNENYPGRLYESYCQEDGLHGRETYDCPSNKCVDGACVAEEISTE